MKILYFFLYLLVGHFCPPGSGSGYSNSNECGSGSTTLLLQVPMTKLELRSVLEPYGEPTVTEMSTPYRGYVFVDLRTTEARAVQVKVVNGHEIILAQTKRYRESSVADPDP
jgi:hypothetical protein